MITEKDLHEAIAECQGERNPNANTCMKLAAYYTILREITGKSSGQQVVNSYSFSSAPDTDSKKITDFPSNSEFAEAVNSKSTVDVLLVIDELMDTLKIIQPRLYESVIRKIREI